MIVMTTMRVVGTFIFALNNWQWVIFFAGKIVSDSLLSPGGMWILFYVAHPDFKIMRSA
jgi:hypothetical protein